MSEHEPTDPVPASAWIYPTLIHGILGLIVFARLLVAGHTYGDTFRKFNLLLPKVAEWAVLASESLQRNLAVAVAGLSAFWLVDGLSLWMLGGRARSEGRTWFWVGVVLLSGTWLLMEVSLFLAYYKLQEALSR